MNKIEDLGEFIEITIGMEIFLINKRHIISLHKDLGSKVQTTIKVEGCETKFTVSQKYDLVKEMIIKK